MKNSILITTMVLAILSSCSTVKQEGMNDKTVNAVIDSLSAKSSGIDKALIKKGVEQSAAQWRESYGDAAIFSKFCMDNFMTTPKAKEELFNKLSASLELIYSHIGELSNSLKKPLHLDIGVLGNSDYIFGGYEPGAHIKDDLYDNKIAFIAILNFPFFDLKEKNDLGSHWSRLEWAYAKMGDQFTPQPPAKINQMVADAALRAESYISEYNIMAGSLINEEGKRLFPEGMKLLSHWNIRDEIKSNYAPVPDNIEKQKMLYQVMLRIIDQTIPAEVINNNTLTWDPYSNKVFGNGKEIQVKAEGGKRYEILLDQFKANREMDQYTTAYPTAIKRAFDAQMQMSVEEIEQMFDEFMTSPKIKELAEIIKRRLGRELEPYDIWYDGFKARSTISQESLDAITTKRYPTAEAFDKDIPQILGKLGFSPQKAEWLGNAIVVEAARGSGHAMGAAGKEYLSRLRTRLSPKGMDYKGFNIAMHELGHNVEQTFSMRNVDYYMLNGVPNTAFTEANAFVFQKRDLQVLGFGNPDADQVKKSEMDIQWGAFEIMGVALTDINVWRWMYSHPEASPQELQEAVITIAKDIWNKYFAPVIGVKDSPILAIYSHMINYPLYLANYPLGHIIEYQLEKFYMGKNMAKEMERIYSLGSITPQQWMYEATGEKISVKAMTE
jgi:hypothetical protein